MSKSVMQARKAENPAAVSDSDALKQLEGYKVLGVLTPEYNCCVQKVIGEMAPYLKDHGIAPAMGFDEDPKKLVEAMPHWMMYLRTGVKINEPIPHLAACDGYTNFFKSLGVDLFYYLDDALFFVNNNAPLKLLWNCDKAIVATEALAEFLIEKQKYPKPIYLLKTHMDIPVFDAVPKPKYLIDENRVNILFTSQGRIGALMIHRIMEYMDLHPEKYKNINFIVVSAWVAQMRTILNRFRNIRKKYWEWMPLLEHYGLAKSVDLILAPGEEADLEGQVNPDLQHFWLHAKSCVKYTLAGAARIPIIAAPLNEYEKAIRHGETGFLASTLEEWIEYIDLLLNDADLRKKVGEEARKDVEKNWHIKDRTLQLVNILNKSDECLIAEVKHDIPAQVSDVHTELQLSQEGVSNPVPKQRSSPTLPESADLSH